MFGPTILKFGLVGAAALGVAACTDGYGRTGVSVGYGSAGYYDGAYGDPYWGWNGDYYYPGTGYYVYDRDRRPTRWNESQRAYWEQRRQSWRGDRRQMRDNWRDHRRDDRRDDRRDRRRDRRPG